MATHISPSSKGISTYRMPIDLPPSSPAEAYERLRQGNRRFLARQTQRHDRLQQVYDSAAQPQPFAMVLSCMDSRLPSELIFDQRIGDIYHARVAGNVLNADILGSMEYAASMGGAKLILVLGHTGCGAVRGACDGLAGGHISPLLGKLKLAIDNTPSHWGERRTGQNEAFVNRVAQVNVQQTVEAIKKQSPLLYDLYRRQLIDIRGAMYDVESGWVRFE